VVDLYHPSILSCHVLLVYTKFYLDRIMNPPLVLVRSLFRASSRLNNLVASVTLAFSCAVDKHKDDHGLHTGRGHGASMSERFHLGKISFRDHVGFADCVRNS
jgi:hypothetical protein